jgi:hypothetical protein
MANNLLVTLTLENQIKLTSHLVMTMLLVAAKNDQMKDDVLALLKGSRFSDSALQSALDGFIAILENP